MIQVECIEHLIDLSCGSLQSNPISTQEQIAIKQGRSGGDKRGICISKLKIHGSVSGVLRMQGDHGARIRETWKIQWGVCMLC